MARPGRRFGTSALALIRAGRGARVAALLACWSLLFQSLIPLLHVPPSDATAAIPAWELASICHVDLAPPPAMRDRGGQPTDPAPDRHPPLCPICLGLHLAGTFLAPPSIAVPMPVIRARALFFETRRRRIAPSRRRLVQARAPPATA